MRGYYFFFLFFIAFYVRAYSSDSFCNNPVDYICHSKNKSSINRLKRQAKAFARQKVLEDFGIDIEAHVNVHHSYSGGTLGVTGTEKGYKALVAYARHVEKKLRESFDYTASLRIAEEKAKILMEKVIQESKVLTQNQKDEKIAQIKRSALKSTPEEVLKTSPRGHFLFCTPSGLLENATSGFFCPGSLINMMEIEPQYRYEGILMIMAHEIGHNIPIPEPHRETQMQCLENNYAHHPEDGISASEHHGLDFSGLKGEIKADYWAARASAVYMRELPQERRADFLRNSWTVPCIHSKGTSWGHPMGWFRLEVSLRREPEVAELLGCTPHYQGTTIECTLPFEKSMEDIEGLVGQNICGPNQRRPHYREVGDVCLPSCGSAKGRYCRMNDCTNLKVFSGNHCRSPQEGWEFF